MEVFGRQWIAVAALIVMLLLAVVVHGADVACEKESGRAEEMRWGLLRGEISEAAFKKAITALARCNVLHDQSQRASDQAVQGRATQALRAACFDAIRRAIKGDVANQILSSSYRVACLIN